MKRLFNEFWNDHLGLILSSEAVLLGTVGVIGATVGLSVAATSVNDEMAEMAYAFRSLDQSFSFESSNRGGAWTAGSRYIQPPVEESHAKLRENIEQERQRMEEAERQPVIP